MNPVLPTHSTADLGEIATGFVVFRAEATYQETLAGARETSFDGHKAVAAAFTATAEKARAIRDAAINGEADKSTPSEAWARMIQRRVDLAGALGDYRTDLPEIKRLAHRLLASIEDYNSAWGPKA